MEDMKHSIDVRDRTEDLYFEVKGIVAVLEGRIPNLYTPEGFYEVFRSGVFAVPYLWEGREEFAEAIKWKTGLVNGSVQVLDDQGKPIKPSQRLKQIF